jgi:C4-type Zn-finger protein
MATNCDACGHKTNEVKSSGGIEPTGVKIEIHIKDAIDLKRDVLKVNFYFVVQNNRLNNIYCFRAIRVMSRCRSLN